LSVKIIRFEDEQVRILVLRGPINQLLPLRHISGETIPDGCEAELAAQSADEQIFGPPAGVELLLEIDAASSHRSPPASTPVSSSESDTPSALAKEPITLRVGFRCPRSIELR
jgi:hypothetical protein